MGPLIHWQVGNTALIVFVSYFGSRVHRPRLIGYGAVLVALAGLLMSLPHFISEPYRYDRTSSGKSRKGWAGDGPQELPRALAGPPHSLGPSLGGSFWQSWGVGSSWGSGSVTLWASLGQGLPVCHCVFEAERIYNTASFRACNRSSGNVHGVIMMLRTTCGVVSSPCVFVHLILTRSHDVNERTNECMNKLKNESILDRNCEAQ